MAYRRRHGVMKSSTFKEEVYYPTPPTSLGAEDDQDSSSLAVQVAMATAAKAKLLLRELKTVKIRLQLETLLAEKARPTHENATYARDTVFLSEIVEYHQLTMRDVMYLEEGIEEVTEVYPQHPTMASMHSMPSTSPMSPTSPVEIMTSANTTKEGNLLKLPPISEEEKDPSAEKPSSSLPPKLMELQTGRKCC